MNIVGRLLILGVTTLLLCCGRYLLWYWALTHSHFLKMEEQWNSRMNICGAQRLGFHLYSRFSSLLNINPPDIWLPERIHLPCSIASSPHGFFEHRLSDRERVLRHSSAGCSSANLRSGYVTIVIGIISQLVGIISQPCYSCRDYIP